jgi:hypothetical protein
MVATLATAATTLNPNTDAAGDGATEVTPADTAVKAGP